MKKALLRMLLIAITVFRLLQATSIQSIEKPTHCFFVDLEGHEAFVYDPFIELLQATGFAPTYIGLDTFIDEKAIVERIATQSKGLFLVVNVDLLAHISTSPIGKKLTTLLTRIAQVPNFFVCLLLPNFNNLNLDEPFVPCLNHLFEPLGIDTSPVVLRNLEQHAYTKKPINTRALTTAAIDFFIKHPITSRRQPFHTSLLFPHEGRRCESRLLTAANNDSKVSLSLLPMKARSFFTSKMHDTLPYFLYTYSAQKKLHVMVGYSMLTHACGITEQFHIRPLKTSLAQEMLALMGLGLAQFHSLVTQAEPAKKNFHDVVKNTAQPDCSLVIDSFGHPKDKKSTRLAKVAWMELNIFESLSPEQNKTASTFDRERRQAKLISYLVRAKFDGLWISFNPHQYWSPIARKKRHEEIFLQSVSNFTKQLAVACKRSRVPVPAILVGFEITNNIYQPNLPGQCAVDVFSNEFNDIPAPLNQAFWDNEVIRPLETFCEKWKDQNLSNGIPLRGVVLDLEMYCRKRIGSFTPVCGFEQETLAQFDAALVGDNFSVHQAVQKLMDQSRYTDFLKMRTEKAQQLGLTLRTAFKKALGDDAYIICYAQNLMIDWFYKGLYQGLATKSDPLELLTFNAEFMRNRPWLENNKIYVNHGSVVLLSKITSFWHFNFVRHVMQAHQSVWLNRISRLVEDYEPKSWISIEQTPLSDSGKQQFIRYLSTL